LSNLSDISAVFFSDKQEHLAGLAIMASIKATGLAAEGKAEPDIKSDFELLRERDIPGASLDGKKPRKLNVAQLKRWLACRGVPTSGKKPQLIERLIAKKCLLLLLH